MSSRFGLPVLAILLSSSASAQFDFTQVAAERGLSPDVGQHEMADAVGTAVGDVDGDGWLDVAIFGATDPRPQIFRNHGSAYLSGSDPRWFHNVSEYIVSKKAAPAAMGVFADLDNDGDPDMITVRRYHEPLEGEPDVFDTGIEFLRNDGGRFRVDVAQPFLARAARRPGGIAIADTDVDGDLDVIYCHNGGQIYADGGPGHYLINQGWPRFEDQTDLFGAELGDSNRYFQPVLADFNGDMLPDLHVAVDFFIDFHCRNIGGGVFQDVTVAAGTTNVGADMGLAVGDVENDGDLDIYSTNINYGVLYVNDGAGKFQDQAGMRGVGGWGPIQTIGWGAFFGDLDLDRDQDLAFVAIGEGAGHIYENDGNGFFTDVTAATPVNLFGLGLIPFDYDRDGDQDMLVARLKKIALYENHAADDGTRHWVVVTLEGTTSNRDGVGAKVQVETADGTLQTRHILAGYSYISGPPMTAHFGLGDIQDVKELTITWPSGKVEKHGPLAGDQYLHFVE